MLGKVFWESGHAGEEWDGGVDVCVQLGNLINVVFNCTDLGEGQITLTNTTDEQVATSRFTYYGHQDATRVGVRGRFHRRPEVLVFEGIWTDPIDGTGEWKFTIEFDDVDKLTLTDTSLAGAEPASDALAEQAPCTEGLTDWYPIDVEPARPGVYQVLFRGRSGWDADRIEYLDWDGARWRPAPATTGPQAAPGPAPGTETATMESWRGLTRVAYLRPTSAP